MTGGGKRCMLLVQLPGPAPSPTNPDPISKIIDGTKSQKLKLFILGKAISGAPISSGTKYFKTSTIAGIIMKNIIRRPCEVIQHYILDNHRPITAFQVQLIPFE